MGRIQAFIGVLIFFFIQTEASAAQQAANEPQHLSERASIDCIKVATQSTNTVARILCSGRDGAAADWDLNSTMWALNGSSNEAQKKALDQEQQRWRDAINRSCMLSKDSPVFSPQQKQCVLDGLHKRATSLRSGLSGDVLAESRLTPEQHAEIQKRLIDQGLLKGRADGEFRADTRQAIRTFQEAEGSTPTGFLSQDQLSHLRSNHQPSTSQKSAQSSKTLTPSELDFLRARLTEMWNVQSNQGRPEELIVDVRIHFGRDRRLSAAPEVVSQGSSPRYQAAANAAVLAVIHAQPYDMLRDDTYDQWKDMIVTFDPRQMFNDGSENNASKPKPVQPDTAFPDSGPKVSGNEQPRPAEPAGIPTKSETDQLTAAADAASPPPTRDPDDVVAQVLNYSTFGKDEGDGASFWYKVGTVGCVYKKYIQDQKTDGINLNELDPQNIGVSNQSRYIEGLDSIVTTTTIQHIDRVITSHVGQRQLDIERLRRGWALIFKKYCTGKERPF